MPFAIHLKHDTAHKTWKPLSVVMLQSEPLVKDLPDYIVQYAADHQMNPQLIAGRVVELTSSQIGGKVEIYTRIVHQRDSDATANRSA